MSESLSLNHSHPSFQYGEIRRTGYKDEVLSILENVWGGVVRSRVTKSSTTNVRVGDILCWTINRWNSFEIIAHGMYICVPQEDLSRPAGNPSLPTKDLTLPQGANESGIGEAFATPPGDESSGAIQHPRLPEPPTLASLGLLENIPGNGWDEAHFVANKRGMIRFSQEGKNKFQRLTQRERQVFIEELEIVFSQKGYTLIMKED